MDPPSDTNDYFRVDVVKQSVEDKYFGNFPTDTHEASFAHSFDVEAKKAFRDIDVNLLEAPSNFVNSKSPNEFIEVALSSSSHHKPYKERTKKWCAKKKKKTLELHYESDQQIKLGNPCLNLFPSKLKAERVGLSAITPPTP
ncbi:hypothetical protein TorRG33x02_287590 [Trema orientale]|uniref:Uncharacterized protein n=1 Tax=Trema orientale TaxID=63057 RepID=A0A2P5CF39_TREOI|nr:hypothetical protein TorRG33x02_287590 [Trema orientale]